jgi:hypothetical protein
MNLCTTANATRAQETTGPTSQMDLIIRNPQQLVFSPPAKQNHEPLQPARLPSPEALMARNSHMDILRTHMSSPQNVLTAPPEPQARTAVCVTEPRATENRDR